MPARAALLAAAALTPWVAAAATTTQQRPAGGFDRIEVNAAVDVEVREGPSFAVAVTIAPDAQGRIETAVKGRALVIGVSGSLRTLGPARVQVDLPSLRGLAVNGPGSAKVHAAAKGDRDVALEVNGSGDVAWRGQARKLSVRVRGAGDVRLEGEARRLDAVVDGAGAVRARGLAAADATLRTHGSGDLEATLRGGALRASSDGSGAIRWWGQAKLEESRVSGAGEIEHAE
jgi:hypothetical protein